MRTERTTKKQMPQKQVKPEMEGGNVQEKGANGKRIKNAAEKKQE